MDMIQCAFIRSEKEVVDGYILSDGEIVERLQTLSHMKEIDYWQIVGSVWAASTMSRPILERYGQNVPLLARQILIPVLAVGLCYGIETDVVQMVAQYISPAHRPGRSGQCSARGVLPPPGKLHFPDGILRPRGARYGALYPKVIHFSSSSA